MKKKFFLKLNIKVKIEYNCKKIIHTKYETRIIKNSKKLYICPKLMLQVKQCLKYITNYKLLSIN